MKCYILDKRVVFEQRDKVDARHSNLFHGVVDTHFPLDDNNEGDALVNHLHLRKNGSGIATVLKPSRNLVVAESVRKDLERFPHTGFFKVAFSCLFKADKLNDSWPVFRDYEKLMAWMADVKHDSSLEREIPAYYEVIIPRYTDILKKFPGRASLTFDSFVYESPVELQVSEKMMQTYPALWTAEGILVNAKFYEVIEPHLDRRFYVSKGIEFKDAPH